MATKLDQNWYRERERLARLEDVYDPWTVCTIEAMHPQEGWQCLEVGAGGGSIASWLCARVGESGHVVATDIETKFLEGIDAPNCEVLVHNIVTDEVEEGQYDLIHARALLDHLPERDEIVRKLVRALKPGGWLTLACNDISTVAAVAGEQADRAFFDSSIRAVIEFGARLFDPYYGRGLGSVLRGVGLQNVRLDGYITEWGQEHPFGSMYDLTFQRLREPVIEAGALGAEDYDRFLEMMRAPNFRALSHTLYYARGRRAN